MCPEPAYIFDMTDCAFRKSGLTSGHTVSSVDYVRAPLACTCVSVTSRFDLCRVCMESLLECFGMVQMKQIAGKHLKFPVSACLLVCEYTHVKTCVTWPSTPEPPSLAASPQGWWQRNRIYPGHSVFSECFFTTQTFGFDILTSQKKNINRDKPFCQGYKAHKKN